jgi:hypothetical protein
MILFFYVVYEKISQSNLSIYIHTLAEQQTLAMPIDSIPDSLSESILVVIENTLQEITILQEGEDSDDIQIKKAFELYQNSNYSHSIRLQNYEYIFSDISNNETLISIFPQRYFFWLSLGKQKYFTISISISCVIGAFLIFFLIPSKFFDITWIRIIFLLLYAVFLDEYLIKLFFTTGNFGNFLFSKNFFLSVVLILLGYFSVGKGRIGYMIQVILTSIFMIYFLLSTTRFIEILTLDKLYIGQLLHLLLILILIIISLYEIIIVRKYSAKAR